MKDIEPSARLYKEAGAEFMTMTAMTNLDTDQPVKSPVTFVLRESILVTVRYSDPKPFKLFLARASKPGSLPLGGGEVGHAGPHRRLRRPAGAGARKRQ